jgi:hypothetical protein
MNERGADRRRETTITSMPYSLAEHICHYVIACEGNGERSRAMQTATRPHRGDFIAAEIRFNGLQDWLEISVRTIEIVKLKNIAIAVRRFHWLTATGASLADMQRH